MLLIVASICCCGAADEPTQAIDFNQTIRPILTQHCSACHGGVKQAGGVSFIYADQVLPPDGWVIEPGDADASVLMERVTTDDLEMRMPPVEESPDGLSDEEIERLRQWIDEGAKWSDHWSIGDLVDVAVVDHSPASTSHWARGRIDEFVESRLRSEGLSANADAPPGEWLRRVSFDLVGLPPSTDQHSAFESACVKAVDRQALEKVYSEKVDELLANPHFGERWAAVWMDLARYADSKGFEKDPHRDMWPYRDWLIRAFNADMPYDQFTIKQLAGDLLPEPTADDLIATAFNRNTQTNTEGGTDDEEFRVLATIDRVNTTWTVWQATTFGCVQCHAHPYDAYQHDEYYQNLALFNNSLDSDLDSDFPTLKIPSDESQIEVAYEKQLRYRRLIKSRNQMGLDWVSETEWNPLVPVKAESTGGRLKIVADEVRADGGTFPVGVKYTVVAKMKTPSLVGPATVLRLEIRPLGDDPLSWPEQGSLLTHLGLQHVASSGIETPIEIADVFVDALTNDGDPRDCLNHSRGGVGGFPKLNGPRQAYFVLKQPLVLDADDTLRFTMLQSASTTGNVATPLRRFQWQISDGRRWSELIQSRSFADQTKALDDAKKAVSAIDGSELPVILERPDTVARVTRQFIRGNWLDRGDEVDGGIPEIFANRAGAEPIEVNDRLEMARWLVSDENPLAARVWANRIWQQLFSLGIVETLEDFGSSGLMPSHPGLLDYLAIQLRDTHHWHLKSLIREIVLSSTYRQSNATSREKRNRDPRNQWLSRGPRTRLSAEMVRDQALAVSGLINEEIGGNSVMPWQPDGVWQTVYSGAEWKTAKDDSRYRRALYTYWRRTSPYPSMILFDTPTRDLCSARRIATNTPLQALVTLNDPVYVECAEALARRGIELHQKPAKPLPVDQTIAWMFEAVTQQPPSEFELSVLTSLYDDLWSQQAELEKETSAVEAMSIVASTLLNLDKALTK